MQFAFIRMDAGQGFLSICRDINGNYEYENFLQILEVDLAMKINPTTNEKNIRDQLIISRVDPQLSNYCKKREY